LVKPGFLLKFDSDLKSWLAKASIDRLTLGLVVKNTRRFLCVRERGSIREQKVVASRVGDDVRRRARFALFPRQPDVAYFPAPAFL